MVRKNVAICECEPAKVYQTVHVESSAPCRQQDGGDVVQANTKDSNAISLIA